MHNFPHHIDFMPYFYYNKRKKSDERQNNMKITPIKIAVSMVLGIVATSIYGTEIIIPAIILGILLSIIYSIIKHRVELCFILLMLAVIASSLSYSFSTSRYRHPSVEYIGEEVAMNGEIVSPAQESPYNDNYRYKVRLRTITKDNTTVKSKETVMLTSPLRMDCGKTISFTGTVKEFMPQMNEHGFDTATYYKSCDIFTRIYSENIIDDTSATPSAHSLSGRISQFIDNKIYNHYEGDAAAILSAILTGSKYHFSAEYKDALSETGTSRLFHPAYLHIFIILTVVGLFRRILPQKLRDIITLLIFIVYAMLQTGSVGFARCLMCAAAAIIFRMRYGSSYYPDTMSAVIIFCSLTMPTIIFNVGFILSVAGGMIVWAFSSTLAFRLRKLPKPLRRPVAVMLVCLVFYTPLSMYYYSGVCIYSFILPLVTAPLVVCALITGPVTLLLMELFGTAPLFGSITKLIIDIFNDIPFIIKDLPLSSINIPSPSIPALIACISAIFLVYYILHKRRKQIIVFSAILSCLCLLFTVSAILRIGTVEVTFVNVDNGDGSVIHRPYKDTVVIDGGGGNGWTTYNPGKTLFVPYLKSEGYNHIDIAIVSHYHQDHVEGLINMMNSIKTDVVIGPAIYDYYSDTALEWADKLRKCAEENGAELRYITEDTRIELDDGLIIELFVLPPEIGKKNENDSTMPAKITYGDFSVLYTGDLTTAGEMEFIKKTDVDADVLKVSHHGSKTSSAPEFIEAVSPVCSVISCGVSNTYGHPADQTLETLKNTEILRTDRDMDIKISARKNGKCYVIQ